MYVVKTTISKWLEKFTRYLVTVLFVVYTTVWAHILFVLAGLGYGHLDVTIQIVFLSLPSVVLFVIAGTLWTLSRIYKRGDIHHLSV